MITELSDGDLQDSQDRADRWRASHQRVVPRWHGPATAWSRCAT